MKREDVSKIFEGATDEQINSILDINSADIGKAKGDSENLKNELKTSKEVITKLTDELQTLKDSNASAEDWKQKFEILDADIKKKEKEAAEAAAKAERESNIRNRFKTVFVDKDGNELKVHEAIKDHYLHKFIDAVSNEENAGKSDSDIYHALTKDDPEINKGIQPKVNLAGASPLNSNEDDIAKVKAVMGIK